MWTCPNTSVARPMLLRYKWRIERKVNDFPLSQFLQSCWTLNTKVVALSVVSGDGTEVWGDYI
jgi:hypothetical protein